ncbi:helicase-related protein [Bacillus sp. FJAT-50079]|uniref:helicase-related protein n=1 Tax=Bacillus sp. FJAT-50079 TaxID=2833577 RepID=UPI001BC93132|nr:helicase-related protein [Bacillus sp. FJAT-50079]MBS4208055.1 helicase [Bacillus sp. FJAT-50079]
MSKNIIESNKLFNNIKNRDKLVEALKNELVGPIPVDKNRMKPLMINENAPVVFNSIEEMREHYYNAESEEEILQINIPIMQYSAGILFPYEVENVAIEEQQINNELYEHEEGTTEIISKEGIKELDKIDKRSVNDFDQEIPDLIPGKNDFAPSSIALSFYAKLNNDCPQLKVNFEGGIYRPFEVKLINDSDKPSRSWWYRIPVNFTEGTEGILFDLTTILNKERSVIKKFVQFEHLCFQLQLYSRISDDGYLITISATNITESEETKDMENILFQSKISVELVKDNDYFDAYPSHFHTSFDEHDEETLSSNLLYRDVKNFALGHGCSADWIMMDEKPTPVKLLSTFMPEHEMRNMTPDITDENGNEFSLSMLELAGVTKDAINASTILSKIVDSYSQWIEERENEISHIKDPLLQEAAKRHMSECRKALERMNKGLKCLEKPDVLKAFQLANYAMAIQQVIGTKERKGKLVNGQVHMDDGNLENYDIPSVESIVSIGKGKWRAFQAAFLLMSLPSFCGDKEEREIADLIWFPTGGGKTEAYLGVAAFSMFFKRLKDKTDTGTDVIMRYTLRLLTADQFQRSSRLICAMEILRRKNEDLIGEKSFSIGIWLGGDTTPNSNSKGDKSAKSRLDKWKKGDEKQALMVKNCPWCGAGLGRYDEISSTNNQKSKFLRGRFQKVINDIQGYKFIRGNAHLNIYCPDAQCPFHSRLPVYIVDETIYEVRPTLIIGTVDKFAMLAWRPEARRLFGLEESGRRDLSPPNLIIQDELHLISGPLGSMTGLYELLVEELCTDRRNNKSTKPKIICATATVRGYKDQVNALYAREKEQVALFPSPGLSHDDSFFAKTHYDEEGKPSRGRKYIGLSSNLVGLQTLQVKTYSTLLQKVTEFDEKDRDPFWTMLSFYNSIRELGGSLTLFQTDIPSYFLQLKNKHHITEKDYRRYLNSFKELTSRLSNGEVTDAITELKQTYESGSSVDVCLASNIIEVGVDIDRMSLMAVVGQPKNTAQYIQVTGRIGRAWFERPGLVLTMYKSAISRDKSHFEHFKEYHQKLYTHVEATSVTPFSDPCLRRGLYGIIIGWLRQFYDQEIANSPQNIKDYKAELNKLKEILLNRVKKVDETQMEIAEKIYDSYINKMLTSEAQRWSAGNGEVSYFLMYPAGAYVANRYKRTASPVLTSMRNVDASCKGVLTNEYVREDIDAEQ